MPYRRSKTTSLGGSAGGWSAPSPFASKTTSLGGGAPSVGGGGGGGGAGPAGPSSPVGGAPAPVSSPRPVRGPVGGGTPFRQFSPPQMPRPQQVTVKPPTVGRARDIDVTAKANPQLDALLRQQQENVHQLATGTGMASDITALRTADAFAGAQNAARYAGGEGASGIRATRQGQLQDATLRANAARQADLTLGREQMITNALQGQLPTILGQQQGMLGQQGIGLQTEALRQQQNRDLFGQGLAGQQLQLQAHQLNQQGQGQAFNQYLAMLNQRQQQNPYGYGAYY